MTDPVLTAPLIPGYEVKEYIGGGGFADVFLYEQESPNQEVAVKVLRPDAPMAKAGRDTFTDEANLMAKVSSHPNIVRVSNKGISDDGRPYIIMALYRGENFLLRARRERIPVPEVLRIGIQLAGAVEFAHRAGILHRDIKPANILTSEFDQPALTDFGIASGHEARYASDGMSVPWSPPESFGRGDLGQTSDVYSLAATLYTLLAGRSPFEIPGGDNSTLAMAARIEHGRVPPIGRDDVPQSLDRVLAVAMSKDPSHRPRSALELGLQLQRVETELHLTPTRIPLPEEGRRARNRDEEDLDVTRVTRVTEIAAQPESAQPQASVIDSVGPRPDRHAEPVPPQAREGLLPEPPVLDTVLRPKEEPVEVPAEPSRPSRRALVWAGAALAGGLVIFLVVGMVLRDGAPDRDDDDLGQFEVNDVLDAPAAVSPPSVDDVVGVDNGDGTYTFEWEAPQGNDDYEYVVSEGDGGVSERITETTYESLTACIDVEVLAPDSGLFSAPTRGCVEGG